MANDKTADRAAGRDVAPQPAQPQKSREDAARRDAARFREALAQVDRASDRDIDRSLRRAY